MAGANKMEIKPRRINLPQINVSKGIMEKAIGWGRRNIIRGDLGYCSDVDSKG